MTDDPEGDVPQTQSNSLPQIGPETDPVDVFEAIGDPMVLHDTESDEILAVNESFCDLLGYSRDELVGASVADFTAIEYVDSDPTENIRKAKEHGSHTFEWVDRRKDGEILPVEVTLTPIQFESKSRILGIVRDISERKERERRLSEEQAFIEGIFSALPDPIYAFDSDGRFLRWNDRFAEVTGYSDEEIAEMHPTDFIAPSDREVVLEAIGRVFEDDTAVTVEAQFETKDGEKIPYEFTGAKLTDDGGTEGLVGVGRDISERKARQRRLEAIFDNAYQLVGLMEPDGTILKANRTALEFAGVKREDLVGTKLWESRFFQTDETTREIAREAVRQARNGDTYRNKVVIQGVDNTEVVDFSVRPVEDEQGNVTLLIPEGRPITDLKQRERHLEILHRFLRHNLRNKLTVIGGTAAVLSENLRGTEYERYADLISESATELSELSETAHELSRVAVDADSERKPVPLGETLTEVIEGIERRYPDSTIDVRLEIDPEEAVAADWRLGAVFEQLLENAIEHVDGDPVVSVSAAATETHVVVRFEDNGPGIPENELTGIITDEEPTQLNHGTGFGLWLVRLVIDDYGGDLSYEESAAGGSILTVRLPRSDRRTGRPLGDPTVI